MRRFKEPLKTLLIVLLTASAVFLAWKGSLFSAFFPERASAAAPTPEAPEQSYAVAALPVAAAVRGPSGLCFGVKYDEEAMDALFDGFSAILSETLGSAEEPMAIGRYTWQDRLLEESLYLDYGFDLPIAALAAWMGVEAPWAGEMSARSFLLDQDEGGSVRLSCRCGDGSSFQCATAASWATLRGMLEEYRPNGAAFAFELPALGDCDPFLLVLEQLPALSNVHITAERSAAAAACAELFGFNLGSQSRYYEADGTLVYPGENGVLRLWADGSVGYTASEEGGRSVPAAADRIEEARRLAETVHAAFAGEEKLCLARVEADEAGGLSLSFVYVLDGVRVELAAGPAARAVWRAGKLSELTLQPRSCRKGEAAGVLLPEMQAAAAAGSIRRGAAPELVLPEAGEERIEPTWIVTMG